MSLCPSLEFPARKTVLVVDDDQDYRLLIAKAFEKLGFEAITASDGVDALCLVRGSPRGTFTAVWSDINMPKMDGIEFSRTLRCLEYTFTIILASGSLDRSGYDMRHIQSVTPHYLEKPPTLELVAKFIKSIFG